MEIENSPIWDEAKTIMDTGETTSNFGWKALVHYQGIDYRPIKVQQVNSIRDFIGAFTEELTCTLLIPLGKYARKIYPNRQDLEITLIKYPHYEYGDEDDTSDEITTERYKATLVSDAPSPTDGQGTERNDEDTLDLSDVLEVHFQLRGFAIEQIRLLSTGGVIRRDKIQESLRTILKKEVDRIDVDPIYKIQGIDIVDVDNKEDIEQLVITHGTAVVDVPGSFQKKHGLYSSGLGHFIQDKLWYVYPLYDTDQINKREKTTTLIVLPSKKYSNVERTFQQKGNHLTILVTGDTAMKDDEGTEFLNQGNGARYSNAIDQVSKWGTTEGNKLKVKRVELNSEYVSVDRDDIQNNAPITQNRITANPHSVYSSINARNGSYFKGMWENHDIGRLIPGMPLKIVTFDDDEHVEYEGVLHYALSRSVRDGDLSSNRFKNNCVIYAFIRKVETTDAPT